MQTTEISAHLSRDESLRLLGLAGFRYDERGRYVSPMGESYWELDEALGIALREIAASNGIAPECWDEA